MEALVVNKEPNTWLCQCGQVNLILENKTCFVCGGSVADWIAQITPRPIFQTDPRYGFKSRLQYYVEHFEEGQLREEANRLIEDQITAKKKEVGVKIFEGYRILSLPRSWEAIAKFESVNEEIRLLELEISNLEDSLQ